MKTSSGYRDSRGEWRPDKSISFAPVFVLPPKLGKFLIWLFNYIFTWNILYLGLVLLSYYFLQPPLEEMNTFKFSWLSIIFIRNMTLVWIVYGGWHLYLYKLKKRGTRSKYCPRWQSTNGSTFLWNDQVYDNVFWACVSAVPIWTAYEAVTFWLYANNKLPYLDFQERPVLFILLFLTIPLWRELHFYLIHRLIHWKPLYDKIHYLHHYNINPGPWSGLAMHPVEHFLYFSVVLIHWVVPSHPLHFLFNSQHTALTPAPGHTGFEGKIFKYLTFGSYFHYLHHRLFECNYGESTIPLDKWFGIFEDGAQTQTEKNEAASAYQKLEVVNIVNESPEVKSFYLAPLADKNLKCNIPGQHFTFKIPFHQEKLHLSKTNADDKKINYSLRSYTISNTFQNKQYRISVKKEADGKVSSAFHNSLKVGDILEAKGPKGDFIHQHKKRTSSVFIAAGIGITPILSMLKGLDKSKYEFFLFLAAKNETLLPFKNELQEIYARHENIQMHFFYSQATDSNKTSEACGGEIHIGRLSIGSLQSVLPEKRKFNFYICGPTEMNETLTRELKDWKGKNCNVYTESFGAGDIRSESKMNEDVTVHFKKSGKKVKWDAEHSNILEFAESNGINMEAGCMFGECGACSTQIHKGEIAYNYNTATKPVKGSCLPCSCHPTSDIELNV